MKKYFDMHSHLDFASEYIHIAEQAQDQGLHSICSTVVPASYISAKNALAEFNDIHVSLGLHPWWIGDARVGHADIDRFISETPFAAFIGEIGLDFSVRHKDSIERQLEVLDLLLSAISETGGRKLITLHSVKSAGVLLDKLDEHGIFDNNDVIFHWFAGSDDDFGRACSKGCYFSVGMKMLATKAGRKFAAAIPNEQLLLESDSPANEGAMYSIELWNHELEGALIDMADLRKTHEEELLEIVNFNSEALLKKYASIQEELSKTL